MTGPPPTRGSPSAVGDVLTAEVLIEGLRRGWTVEPVGSSAAVRVAEHLYAPKVADGSIGYFPERPRRGYLYTWWQPTPRFGIPLGDARPRRKLVSALARTDWRTTLNRDFGAVVAACARDRWPYWITPDYVSTLEELLTLGHAYSSEVWEGDQLVGGGFGLISGTMVSIESHFFLTSPASKVSNLSTCYRALQAGAEVVDLQWFSQHGHEAGGRALAVDIRRLATQPTVAMDGEELPGIEIARALTARSRGSDADV